MASCLCETSVPLLRTSAQVDTHLQSLVALTSSTASSCTTAQSWPSQKSRRLLRDQLALQPFFDRTSHLKLVLTLFLWKGRSGTLSSLVSRSTSSRYFCAYPRQVDSVSGTGTPSSHRNKDQVIQRADPPSLCSPPRRRRHHRLHDGLLPHPPPQVRPGTALHRPPRGELHRRRRIRQGGRSARPVGLPRVPRTALVPPARRARPGARWRAALGLPPRGLRQRRRRRHHC